MKKFVIQVVALLVVIFACLSLVNRPELMEPFLGIGGGSSGDDLDVSDINAVKIGNKTVNVEVAITQEQRSKGLSNRDALGANDGILFIFDKAHKPQFWMKGMRFPIDIIWIKGDTIADILQSVPPPLPNEDESQLRVYAPVTEIDKVLEVNSGFANKHGWKVGDKVEYISNNTNQNTE